MSGPPQWGKKSMKEMNAENLAAAQRQEQWMNSSHTIEEALQYKHVSFREPFNNHINTYLSHIDH